MPETVRLATQAMGTRFETVVLDADATRARSAGEAALREIELWHARLSLFDRASFLSHINDHAHAGPVALDAEVCALLTLCAEVWSASDGAFDPTIAPEMARRGLHDRPATGTGAVGFDAVALNDRARTIRFTRPGVALDLGGVAKGFALDRAAEVLREAGVAGAFIHGGTSSGAAIGESPDDAGWAVALGAGADEPRIALRDRAYSVSSPSGRIVGSDHHILDPRNGSARIPMNRAAAVWGGLDADSGLGLTGAACDAWSTALVVLGRRLAGMPMELESLTRERGRWSRATGENETEQGRRCAGVA